MGYWFYGEGCFFINVTKNKEFATGFKVQLVFSISLHEKDKALLKQIQNYFSVGSITKQGNKLIQFIISSQKELAVVINHFCKFNLKTEKSADFQLFEQAFHANGDERTFNWKRFT